MVKATCLVKYLREGDKVEHEDGGLAVVKRMYVGDQPGGYDTVLFFEDAPHKGVNRRSDDVIAIVLDAPFGTVVQHSEVVRWQEKSRLPWSEQARAHTR